MDVICSICSFFSAADLKRKPQSCGFCPKANIESHIRGHFFPFYCVFLLILNVVDHVISVLYFSVFPCIYHIHYFKSAVSLNNVFFSHIHYINILFFQVIRHSHTVHTRGYWWRGYSHKMTAALPVVSSSPRSVLRTQIDTGPVHVASM